MNKYNWLRGEGLTLIINLTRSRVNSVGQFYVNLAQTTVMWEDGT